MARPEGFEPPTPWFVAKYSIQMSYGRVAGANPINIRPKRLIRRGFLLEASGHGFGLFERPKDVAPGDFR